MFKSLLLAAALIIGTGFATDAVAQQAGDTMQLTQGCTPEGCYVYTYVYVVNTQTGQGTWVGVQCVFVAGPDVATIGQEP